MNALSNTDPEIFDLIKLEEKRQFDTLRLIPSENYVSQAVLDATGTVLTNKYSEGYAGARYYEGQEHIDNIETLAVERAKKLFGADHANVQPYSGSPANLAAYMALLKPGDKVMGMSLPHGGHLTHGWKVSITGKYFESVQYTVDKDSQRLNYDLIREMALAERPQLLIAGATAYPRIIDFEAFASIAQEVGAFFLADIAHIAGLVVGGVHPSPIPHADVVSTTTHKTLRGPRGGMLMCKAAHKKAINRAVFPGLQGGPHNHTTAGIAVALKEADTPEFFAYAAQIVDNARALATSLSEHGFDLVTGGTDNHLILFDATSRGTTGRKLARALNTAGIVTNCNTVPFDPRSPFDPSGVRIGTPAVTSRGMGVTEMIRIGGYIAATLDAIDNEDKLKQIAAAVADMSVAFPPPGLESCIS
ncbi:MAG TPA: serine hydroxymethyltransferase [Myxococcales bacterium]|nr:serine hydroxymethyltransferase [Myxococcales bacterium]HIN85798.1 serine hydroxymethyltransferase [Myxococcales bacterium]